jgi:hypothetical protein
MYLQKEFGFCNFSYVPDSLKQHLFRIEFIMKQFTKGEQG